MNINYETDFKKDDILQNESITKIYQGVKDTMPWFELRDRQIIGSIAGYHAFKDKSHFVGEYPCGSGKTIMYITSALANFREDNEFRALICTEGISLQEQLAKKDLPAMARAYSEAFPDEKQPTLAVMKGRQNYLCKKKHIVVAENFRLGNSAGLTNSAELTEAAKIIEWGNNTKSGDLSELPFILAMNVSNIFTVKNATTDGCSICKEKCFYDTHKKTFINSNIGVINYHLLFSAFETGMPDRVIGDYDAIIFDEAHSFANIARNFRERKVSIGTIARFKRDFSILKTKVSEELLMEHINFSKIVKALEDAERFIVYSSIETIQSLGQKINPHLQNEKFIIGERIDVPYVGKLIDILGYIDNELADIEQNIFPEDEWADFDSNPVLGDVRNILNSLRESILSQIDVLSEFMHPGERKEFDVYWVERENEKYAFCRKPYDVGNHLRGSAFGIRTSFDNELMSNVGSISVSATLAVGGKFDYYKNNCGINNEKINMIESVENSPFNLVEQELWYLPMESKDPKKLQPKEYAQYLTVSIASLLQVSNGGLLALFTSIKQMKDCSIEIKRMFPQLNILVQGDKPKSKLLDEFAKDVDSCLFATKSFFTGIDIKGHSLRVITIDKLPFESPDDPIMKKLGSMPGGFAKYSIPDMMITLKQAVGRGIRSKDDKCIISILDDRLRTASYKGIIDRTFAQDRVVPPRTRSLEAVRDFIGNFRPAESDADEVWIEVDNFMSEDELDESPF